MGLNEAGFPRIRQFWRLSISIVGIILMMGCAALPNTSTESAEQATTDHSPTAAPTQTPTPQPTPDGYCDTAGTITSMQFDSALLSKELIFQVYLPPCYDSQREQGYPFAVLLHGQNQDENLWIDIGALDVADAIILSGESTPFIMVFPREEAFFRNSWESQYPFAIVEELVPWIEENYHTCDEKTCRAIGGISRGANWAMRLGLANYDLFGSVGAHSLPTFPTDIRDLPTLLDKLPTGEEPRITIDVGRFDPGVSPAYRYEQVLNENGIPHSWHLNVGKHDQEYWRSQVEAYLRWYAAGWPNEMPPAGR